MTLFIPFSATAGVMGNAYGAMVGEQVGGYSMAALFDLVYYRWKVNKTLRMIEPTMRWIDQQNIIFQNNYYNFPNNIWY